MSRGKRKTIATGIYRDRGGYSVVWREQGKPQETRFPLDTPLYRLKDHRLDQLARIAKQPKADTRHGLARDIVRYLRLRKARPGYRSEKSHLRAWLKLYPQKSRWAITRDDCQGAVATWEADGVAPQTIRHRMMCLLRLYHALDGTRVQTPLDDVAIPKRPKKRARSVADSLVRTVAENLKQQEETDGRMADAKTRARFLVLATTGQRPAQLMRATPTDVDFTRRLWFVDPAKGDEGTIVYLNDDMFAAWQLFARANAWGPYSTTSHARCLRRAGWPEGVRPYVARHTVGLTLSELGADLGDIQAHMGHSSIETTRTFYVPAVLSRLKAASALLGARGLADLASPAIVPSSGSMNQPETKRRKAGKARKTRESDDGTTDGTAVRKDRKSA